MPFIEPRLGRKQVEDIWKEASSLPAQECYSCGYKGGKNGGEWDYVTGGTKCPKCGSYEVHLSSLGTERTSGLAQAVAKDGAKVIPVDQHGEYPGGGFRAVQPGTVAYFNRFVRFSTGLYFGNDGHSPKSGPHTTGIWTLDPNIDPSGTNYMLYGNWEVDDQYRDRSELAGWHPFGGGSQIIPFYGETTPTVGGFA